MSYTIAGQEPYTLPGVRTPVRLDAVNVPVDALAVEEIDRMYDLMTRSFENVRRTKFQVDLREKDGVIILKTGAGEIRGFSTWKIIESVYEGCNVTALFSGDTIVDEMSRGQIVLFREYVRLMHKLLVGSDGAVYWFLLSKGIKTYLILPMFFHSFYPCVDEKGNSPCKDVLDHLAVERYGNFYDPGTGIVRFDPPADRLKPLNTLIPKRLLPNRHVRQFLDRNPGYTHGDELACLVKLENSNFTKAFYRLLNPR